MAERLGAVVYPRTRHDHRLAHRSPHAAHPGGGAVLAEHVAERAGPFAHGAAGACQLDRRRREVVGAACGLPHGVEGAGDGVGVTAGAPLVQERELLPLDPLVDHQDAALSVERLHEW